MSLLRIFETDTRFKEWTVAKPKLDTLLRCFDVDRSKPAHPTRSISVFQASSATEEVENVAAHFETFAGKRAQVQYGVRIEPDDCRRAGIGVQHSAGEGATGVRFVDLRHFNLNGKQEQFIELVSAIIASLWQGQDRLRVFPAQQIIGQLAVFCALGCDAVQPEAQERCLKTLNKHRELHNQLPDGKRIEIRGQLADGNQSIHVLATRSILSAHRQAWWHWVLEYLLGARK